MPPWPFSALWMVSTKRLLARPRTLGFCLGCRIEGTGGARPGNSARIVIWVDNAQRQSLAATKLLGRGIRLRRAQHDMYIQVWRWPRMHHVPPTLPVHAVSHVLRLFERASSSSLPQVVLKPSKGAKETIDGYHLVFARLDLTP
ncbi:hypothetical protein J3F83DRAFT_534326 [Trichoderma novae-zelandiae]